MESPNAEFRGTEGRFEKLETEQPLSEQYKSMRDLLKVYGLSVSEENSTHPQKGSWNYSQSAHYFPINLYSNRGITEKL